MSASGINLAVLGTDNTVGGPGGSQLTSSVAIVSAPNTFTKTQTITPAVNTSGIVITSPSASSAPAVAISDATDFSGTGSQIQVYNYGTGNAIDAYCWANPTTGVMQGGNGVAVHFYGNPPAGGSAVRFDNCGNAANMILASTENTNNAPRTWGSGDAINFYGYISWAQYTTGVVTGGNTVTDATNSPFRASDVGKPIWVAAVLTTIATFVDQTRITTASNALVTASGVTFNFPTRVNAGTPTTPGSVGQAARITMDANPVANGGSGMLRFINLIPQIPHTGSSGFQHFWSFENPNNNGGYALQIIQGSGSNSSAALSINNAGTGESLLIKDNGGNNKFSILQNGQIRNRNAANESTGAGSAALGANCPAVTASAPFKWLAVTTSDGSQGYIPVWK